MFYLAAGFFSAGAASFSAVILAASLSASAASKPRSILPPCLPNLVVGENSPNLLSVILSEGLTVIKSFPLWTKKVKPIISGVMVDLLDQVLMVSFPFGFNPSNFLNKLSSTKGPFFSDLGILFLLSSLNYKLLCPFLFSCFNSQSGFPPGGHGPGHTYGASSFTSSMRMVNRIH